MVRLIAILFAVIAAGAIGCSKPTTLKDAPVSISGKVSQGGKPVGNVVVWFQPLDHGHMESLPVNTDGMFVGELIGGNYSYYVAKSNDPASAAALKRVDPKYYEPNLGRSVNIEFGKEIVLALD